MMKGTLLSLQLFLEGSMGSLAQITTNDSSAFIIVTYYDCGVSTHIVSVFQEEQFKYKLILTGT